MTAEEKERVDAYLGTIARFEPDITMTDQDAVLSSIAISLKRIADALDGSTPGILADRLGESIYNAITQAALGMNRR